MQNQPGFHRSIPQPVGKLSSVQLQVFPTATERHGFSGGAVTGVAW